MNLSIEGTLLYIGVQEGESAPVDSLLAIIGPAGTDVSAIVASGGSCSAAASQLQPPKRKKRKKKKKLLKLNRTANTSTNNSGGRIFASPLAKKIASDKGINLADVTGSGENGRIVKKDVENFTPAAKMKLLQLQMLLLLLLA